MNLKGYCKVPKRQGGPMPQEPNGRVSLDHRGLKAWRVSAGFAMAAGDMACSLTSHMTTSKKYRRHMFVTMFRSECKYMQEFF